MRARTPHRARVEPAQLEPPRGLEASHFTVGRDEFAILEWPLPRASAPVSLSEAEAEVAALAAEGLSNAEIARRRDSSVRTVANQMASVFRKLGVGSRHELAARLLRDGG